MKNIWKQYIPNMITCLRIVLSCFLLLLSIDSSGFIIVYLICGSTDVIDGYLARKWNVSSKMGAALDSIADVILVAVIFIMFIPNLKWETWMILWILIILGIRISSIMIGLVKFHSIALLHTYANKFTGFLLFFLPLFLIMIGMTGAMVVIGIPASISSVEEMIIMIREKTLDRDHKGTLFDRSRK